MKLSLLSSYVILAIYRQIGNQTLFRIAMLFAGRIRVGSLVASIVHQFPVNLQVGLVICSSCNIAEGILFLNITKAGSFPVSNQDRVFWSRDQQRLGYY